MVKVRHSKGVAIHTDPESCAGYCREAAREALTGGRTGEVLSGESKVVRGAEQSGAIRRGVGGGRRWDQEECGTAKHGPDTESGSRDTSAGPHTRSRNQEQEGEADSALASRQHRRSAVGLL